MSSFSVKYKTSLFGNMDRNNMRSSYVNSGPRSLPHMSGKRHNGNGHNGNSHSGNHGGNHGGNHSNHGNHGSNHSGNHSGNHGNGHNGARLSPPAQGMPGNQHPHNNNNNNPNGQQDDIINYIYDSWNKVTRELERGSDEAKYYQEVIPSRHLANFKPFNLEEWWGRRMIQSINRNKHRS